MNKVWKLQKQTPRTIDISSSVTVSWRKMRRLSNHTLCLSIIVHVSGILAKINMVMHKCSSQVCRSFLTISKYCTKRTNLYQPTLKVLKVWSTWRKSTKVCWPFQNPHANCSSSFIRRVKDEECSYRLCLFKVKC